MKEKLYRAVCIAAALYSVYLVGSIAWEAYRLKKLNAEINDLTRESISELQKQNDLLEGKNKEARKFWESKGYSFDENGHMVNEKLLNRKNDTPDVSEDFENEKIQVALLEKAVRLDDCTITHYCECAQCCGIETGITFSGLPVSEGVTCGVDPAVIPLYSDVFVLLPDGSIEQFWATDTGVQGKSVDIYVSDHQRALQLGSCKTTVWFVDDTVA